MRRTLLACLSVIVVLASRAGGQDAETDANPPAPPPPSQKALAAIRIAGDVPQAEVFEAVERLRDAMRDMGTFESLDQPQSVAALVRLAMTTASIGPGVTVAVTGAEPDPQDPARARDVHIAATLSVDGDAKVDRLLGAWPDPGHGGIVFVRQTDAGVELCFQKVEFREAFLEPNALEAFAPHAPDQADGIELMLDLENLRRAWPQSLADGPARRVVAVTGLANARKVHVHVPESGPARLAYSSRALPPDEVSVRNGPAPAAGSAVGARWPSMFDAGLRTYAVALGDEPRQAFGQQFQQWMGQHGNRLRGIVQAVEIGMDWSIEHGDDGLRTEIVIPVREGIEVARLAEAMRATLVGSGFEAGGAGGTLALPEHVAAALGGSTLSIGIDSQREPAVVQIVIE